MPRRGSHTPTPVGQYDIYPGFPIGSNKIDQGFDALAERLSGQRQVIIDGYGGVTGSRVRFERESRRII